MRVSKDIHYLLILGFLALIFRLVGINFGLPFLYNVDEAQIIPSAVRFGSGDLNPHSFTYPPFLGYLLFILYIFYFLIGHLVGVFPSLVDFEFQYFTDPTPFYLIGRVTVAIMGTLSVIVIYLLGKKAYNRTTGIIAALFLMFSPLFLVYSRVVLIDVPMTLFIILSIYFSYEISQNATTKNYLLAGIFGGLAIATKYNACLIVIPIFVVHLINLMPPKQVSKVRLKPLLLCYLVLIATFFFGNPYSLVDFQTFVRDLKFDSLVVSSPGNPFLGMLEYLKAIFFPPKIVQFGYYLGLFAIAGVIYALYRKTKTDILLLSYPLIHLFWVSYITAKLIQPRYVMPIIPIFFVFGARFMVEVINKIPGSLIVKNGIAYALAFILILYPVRDSIKMCYVDSKKDTVTKSREWIKENIPAESKILYTSDHDLMLIENQESIIYNYQMRQALVNKYSTFEFEYPQSRIDALARYKGIKYFIARLPVEWGGLTEEKTEELGTLPPGIAPLDTEKISISYWKNENIEYVVVFPQMVKQRYFTEEGKMKYPAFLKFYSDLFKSGKLIKRFTPELPRLPGLEVEIYQL